LPKIAEILQTSKKNSESLLKEITLLDPTASEGVIHLNPRGCIFNSKNDHWAFNQVCWFWLILRRDS